MHTILLIEDDKLIQKTVEIKLKKEGYNLVCCNDGKTGVEKLREVLPDLVLTDIMLPYVSGLEIVKAVKSITEKNIPVIVYSTMGQESIVEEAFSLGADDFITKPFNPVELAIRVKRQLR